ncbi:MAG: hypothetical protein JSR58_01190 [Verrucomicrobia bacterium]|nr:hypothetical protein [Verrucomicrobiota bacterium]
MIIIPCVFGAGILSLFLPRTINGETEKKLKQLELTLHEKLVLTQSCQGMLTQFENVTHQLSLTNTERSQIYDVLLSEQSQISSEIDFTKVQQAFLSSLQTLTRELGDLAGQQPDMLKVYVEMAVQIGEEKKWADETHDKMQQLGQELVLVTSEGIETKTRLEKRVSNLTILVQAATSTHPTKLPSRIQAGGYFLSTPLFLFTQTKV